MDALVKGADMEVPKALVAARVERMVEIDPRRHEEARHQGCREHADSRPRCSSPGRAPRAPRPDRRQLVATTTCRPGPTS